ncbi:MAG: M56 family metallopeptidase, partial [Bacteroidaceae bacterium]|nr:M56 family metallopeptidase [Bacteroidaceae bacterium]
MTSLNSLIPMLESYGSILIVSSLLMVFYLIVMSRKQSFRFQRMYLLSIPAICLLQIVALVVLPKILPQTEVESITLTQEEAMLYQSENPEAKVITEELLPVQAENVFIAPPSHKTESFSISANAILKCIYIGIPIVSALLLLIILIPLAQLLIRTSAIRRSNTDDPYLIIQESWVNTPFSMGRIIFLPTGSSKEAEEIFIKHEKAHIQSRHYIDVWCIEVMVRLLWFNPMLWLVRKHLRDLHEFEADHLVLAQGVDAHSYQCLLLEVASTECATITNGFNQSFIRRRIKEMKRKGISVLGQWGKAMAILWVVTLIGGATIFAMPEQNAVVIHIEEKTSATGNGIYSDSEVKYKVRHMMSAGKDKILNCLVDDLESGLPVTKLTLVSPRISSDSIITSDTICLDEEDVRVISQMYENNPQALYEALGRTQPTEEEWIEKRIKAEVEYKQTLYSLKLKKHLGLAYSIQPKLLKIVDPSWLTYSFGDVEKKSGSPIFEVGAICTRFQNYVVLTMDTTMMARREGIEYNPGNLPCITSWMLKNCDSYWQSWLIEGKGGVIMDTDDEKNTTLSDKERAEVKKNIKQLRAKYERTFTSGEFIERTNADKIFVVQIPNLKELKNKGALNNRHLHEKAKKCYAIEFYKKGRKDAMR